MSVRYFYNGIEVPQTQALALWKASLTYWRAAYKDAIWPNAHRDGSPLQPVALTHLHEAGITISKEPPHDRQA